MRCQIWSGSRWRHVTRWNETRTARLRQRWGGRPFGIGLCLWHRTLGWISSELVCWLIKSRLKLERRRKIRFSGFRPISAFIGVVRWPQLFCHEWKLFSRSNYIARFQAHPNIFLIDIGDSKIFVSVSLLQDFKIIVPDRKEGAAAI